MNIQIFYDGNEYSLLSVDMTKESVGVKRRFKQFCIEHQDEFKAKEA